MRFRQIFAHSAFIVCILVLFNLNAHLVNAQTNETTSPALTLVWQTKFTSQTALATPVDIAVDAWGNSYVSSQGSNSIKKFDSDGNFVTQWGDPDGETDHPRSLGQAKTRIPAEFWRARDRAVSFTRLRDPDGYALEVGHSGGFPVARDRKSMWLTHCYAMVGAARGDETDSGTGGELYVVIGHAPRQLDRNITLVGRVVQGMEYLSALPRGSGGLGFYEQPAQRPPIATVRVAADLPGGGPAGKLELLRTDSASFAAIAEARRNRRDAWYKIPAGHIDLCSVLLPVRQRPAQ